MYCSSLRDNGPSLLFLALSMAKKYIKLSLFYCVLASGIDPVFGSFDSLLLSVPMTYVCIIYIWSASLFLAAIWKKARGVNQFHRWKERIWMIRISPSGDLPYPNSRAQRYISRVSRR